MRSYIYSVISYEFWCKKILNALFLNSLFFIFLEIYFLSMTILTLMSFYLAQSLRSAINNGQTVRNIAKFFCSIFCIFVASLFLYAHLSLNLLSSTIIYTFHIFIVIFQMAMIWFPKPD